MTARECVVVVGAGVSGLTTAVVLAEAGASVRVIAGQVPGATSLAAGAMWGPYLVEPKDKVDRWGQRSLEIFRELAEVRVADVGSAPRRFGRCSSSSDLIWRDGRCRRWRRSSRAWRRPSSFTGDVY